MRNQKVTMLLIFIWLCSLPISLSVPTDMVTAPNTTLQNCQRKCGNITIPYPFGIGTNCSISANHSIICLTSFNPPKAFLAGEESIEVLSISETQVKIRNSLTFKCFDSHGHIRSSANRTFDLTHLPFTLSGKANKLTVIGCDDIALLIGFGARNLTVLSGCISWCPREEDLLNRTCSGLGCCQTSIPDGLWNFTAIMFSGANHTSAPFNPCGYSFLSTVDSLKFNKEELSDPTFMNRAVTENYPVVLEWTVGDRANCSHAERSGTKACKANTICLDSTSHIGGYSCQCHSGYQGNPYLGCTDFNECVGPDNPCVHSRTCRNIEGSYKCSCPIGHQGDGSRNGKGCKRSKRFVTMIGLGVSLGLLIIVLCACWLCFLKRKQRFMNIKEEFFKRNGGLMLKQQISSSQTRTAPSMIFSTKELGLATKNYGEDRIIGTGANGIVYKGILPDNRVVAIKKSKIVDQTQIEQFINEVIIVTQINHRNVVKLLGCCLETEVPLLVYECISNGTLLDHIRSGAHSYTSWLTWVNCVRIASEIADALAYMHSAANIPIIHRDVKSANILINECYTAKVSDFGASRFIPIDESQVTTLVQGTLGYLDPEYYYTSQLTEKSDVYSFGVILAELLTRQKPISMERMEGQNLATLFSMAVEDGWVLRIIHPQLIKEADQEQLVSMARLIKGCLNLKREDRPKMKELAVKLDELKEKITHPWAREANDEVTGALISRTRGENSDLLPEQFSMQRELISEMGPR